MRTIKFEILKDLSKELKRWSDKEENKRSGKDLLGFFDIKSDGFGSYIYEFETHDTIKSTKENIINFFNKELNFPGKINFSVDFNPIHHNIILNDKTNNDIIIEQKTKNKKQL